VGLSDEDKEKYRTYFGENVEESTLEQLSTFMRERYANLGPDTISEKRDIAEEVLLRISKSPSMSSITIEALMDELRLHSSGLVSKTALRARLKELEAPEVQGLNHTEIAEHLLKELTLLGEVRFDNSKFYRWGGSHWVPLEDYEILQVLAREFGHLPLAKRRNDHKGILQTLSDLVREPLHSADVPGINFANGFVTADMKMLPHDPKFGCTYVMPYRYVEGDRPPYGFLALLDQAWGEDPDYAEKIQALREAMAVTMFGLASKFARAVCFYGMAHSGKTVLMDIMRGLVPSDACSNVSPHDWQDRFLPTEMVGKLVNFCGEISETKAIDGDVFKMIVEGAEINGQFKGRDIFKFRPTCAQWFAANHLPRTRDTSAGFTRRWLFFTFNKVCPPELTRINLAKEILAEEREAIVSWAIPAIIDVIRRQKYTLPPSHEDQIKEISTLNNSVLSFLKSNHIIYRAGAKVEENDLYRSYLTYTKLVAHAQPMALNRVRLIMRMLEKDRGFKVKTTTSEDGSETHQYVGIGLPGQLHVAA
ncbi:MAG: DNA primase family protein, partial [Caulobacteraceae bacterium]